MTIQLPKICYHDIFSKTSRLVWSPSEDSSYPASNAIDLRWGNRWRPEWSGNILTNWDLLLWSSGVTSAPDDFVLSAGTIARASGTRPGPYAATITGAAGSTVRLYQSISPAAYLGKKLAVGAHILTSQASFARVFIDGGVSTSESPYHPGDGSTDWLDAELEVDRSASYLYAGVELAVGAYVATVFSLMFSESEATT